MYYQSMRGAEDGFCDEAPRGKGACIDAKPQPFLSPIPTDSDSLIEGQGPLSSFSARIQICNRLGLIDDSLARVLHLIRKIRNAMAHDSGATIESGGHQNRIREIVRACKKTESYQQEDSAIRKTIDGTPEDLATKIRHVIAYLCFLLQSLGQSVQPPFLEFHASLGQITKTTISVPPDFPFTDISDQEDEKTSES